MMNTSSSHAAHDPSRPDAIARHERWQRLGLGGATVWFTGLSGAGKSTTAQALAELLLERRVAYSMLDGDALRHGLNADLGFDEADRTENVRRLGEVARLIADAGLVAIVAAISPYRAHRDQVRAAHAVAGLPFLEVFMDTSVQVCRDRDSKGLYARSRAGDLTGLTGVDAPYEAPRHADVHLVPSMGSPVEQAQRVLDVLVAGRFDPAFSAEPGPA